MFKEASAGGGNCRAAAEMGAAAGGRSRAIRAVVTVWSRVGGRGTTAARRAAADANTAEDTGPSTTWRQTALQFVC